DQGRDGFGDGGGTASPLGSGGDSPATGVDSSGKIGIPSASMPVGSALCGATWYVGTPVAAWRSISSRMARSSASTSSSVAGWRLHLQCGLTQMRAGASSSMNLKESKFPPHKWQVCCSLSMGHLLEFGARLPPAYDASSI